MDNPDVFTAYKNLFDAERRIDRNVRITLGSGRVVEGKVSGGKETFVLIKDAANEVTEYYIAFQYIAMAERFINPS